MSQEFNYCKNPNFPNRYISPESLFKYIQENLSDYVLQIGNSTLGLPIYQFSYGTGEKKILAWSQMHGNESNSTHSMLDLWYSIEQNPDLKNQLFSKISLDFIFMLNPDGSKAWTRRNAADIDLNRDFLQVASCEMKLLKKISFSNKYDFALNLHEQRTIFTSDGVHPATLSFLAPSENFEREITPTRTKCMDIIGKVFNKMNGLIPNQIARYSDEFYPTSTGDNLIKAGIPSILFEGGHFVDDYQRFQTRKFYTIALYHALVAISEFDEQKIEYQDYFQIPINKETHFDVIYRNVNLNTSFECIVDIAVQYKEVIEDGNQEILFVPYVQEVGDLHRKKGWKEYDCTGKIFKSNTKFPKVDAMQNFEIV